MKKTTKILSLLVVIAMMFAVVATLAACGGTVDDDKENAKGGEFNIKVWVSEIKGVDELTKAQIQRFNETNGLGYKFNAEVAGVKEGDAAQQMISSVEDGADIFCFAQDQTSRLVDAKALSQPGVKASEEISENNDKASVAAVQIGGKYRAYPLTSDNGYFMYYDKRVIDEDKVDITDLESIVKACEGASKNFSMELETSAWYLASFFFATGCHSSWTTDVNGKFTGVDDDFNSDKGLIAMKGMQILSKSKNHVSSSNVTDFNAAIPSAVVVSGAWAYSDVVTVLGGEKNVGVAPLPSFTVDGKTYHMGSFVGNKLMGVKPTSDANKAAGLSLLARYLTNEECQLERFEKFGWGPSNLAAQENEKVKSAPHIVALAQQNSTPEAVVQGQIEGSWWDTAKVLGAKAKAADEGDETALKAALTDYQAAIDAIFQKTDEDLRKWTVIGIKNDWSTDLEMVEGPENTWTSKDAFDMTAETEWVFRKGGSWDYKVGYSDDAKAIAIRWTGDDIQNLSLAKLGKEPGKYKLKLVLTFDGDKATAATIELIPA